MLRVSQLNIYPVKSLGGISVDSARITDRGLQHDRRWMLIDPHGVQITQREVPALALLQPAITSTGLTILHRPTQTRLDIPFEPATREFVKVQCWDDTVTAQFVGPEADEWFSERLKVNCRLVHMPESTKRQTDLKYTAAGHYTSFADGYPFLLIGEASLEELNSRLDRPLPMNRFRPNIVFTGGEPFEEDRLHEFTIGNIRFSGVKLCARCVMTTIDQTTAEKGKEPLRTLARYRAEGHKILFGQNLIHHDLGEIAVGDELIPIH
ncbi:MAG TPA: MOSC N-terminal beta barrel domain-containing protein [Puia sp.]|uniref:MOSC domain-containing protein n=1 Tax=Puia sp. TaxID=2045100 RepID=UPI002BD3FC94|nr:MOSC N-terminal beta barrel domain-containing protein [Puia sp.]HVU97885.1 MOSC N-terminal beta barrel domain-containing protein [Puia sp.]